MYNEQCSLHTQVPHKILESKKKLMCITFEDKKAYHTCYVTFNMCMKVTSFIFGLPLVIIE